MHDNDDDGAAPDAAETARQLAEAGLKEQALGNDTEADRLLTEAQAVDTDVVAAVLREHDAGRAPDSRLQEAADQDVERVLPRIVPSPPAGMQ